MFALFVNHFIEVDHFIHTMALQSLLGLPINPTFGSLDNTLNVNAMRDLSSFNTTALPMPAMDSFDMKNLYDANNSSKKINIHLAKGTTTLAFRYNKGVVVCADSRATGGQFIGSQEVRKIIPINKYLLGTMAGGAADCTYWERVLSERCRIYELRNKERISVAAASKLLANILYNYKGMGLSLGVMICGWDQKKGAQVFYVDSEGHRMPGDLFSVGSGSTYAYGILDSGYKWDMTDEEAYDLGRRAIYHATHGDAYSGGIVRVASIKEDGWKMISEEDCKDLHYRYLEEKNK
ncbi:proteasome subunit beta type-5-like [Oppia nitens]|uniref:proteasome subunit beta type-5-like n=1 Tax=Oppia nitens TaxID=1686743 RepID=UPI0023D99746|nr:proteasome subunit beta type-5-like [Oppia nitens]